MMPMHSLPPVLAHLLAGPLVESGPFPLSLVALLCDLRPRFLPKCRVGSGYRAVARNGRVLLASDLPVPELTGLTARVRLQTWNRAILEGDRPEPYGVLLCVRRCAGPVAQPIRTARLLAAKDAPADALRLDVGGGLVLSFA